MHPPGVVFGKDEATQEFCPSESQRKKHGSSMAGRVTVVSQPSLFYPTGLE